MPLRAARRAWSTIAEIRPNSHQIGRPRPDVAQETLPDTYRTAVQGGPDFVKFGSHLAEFGPSLADSGSNLVDAGPILAEAGQNWLNSAQNWPIQGKPWPIPNQHIGRIWGPTTFGVDIRRQTWPTPGRNLSKSVQIGPNLVNSGPTVVDIGPIWANFGRILSRSGQRRRADSANSSIFAPIVENLGVHSEHSCGLCSGTLIDQCSESKLCHMKRRQIWRQIGQLCPKSV